MITSLAISVRQNQKTVDNRQSGVSVACIKRALVSTFLTLATTCPVNTTTLKANDLPGKLENLVSPADILIHASNDLLTLRLTHAE